MIATLETKLVDYIQDDVRVLVDSKNLGEEFHSECEFKFVGRIDDKLVGIIAYRLGELQGIPCPQFCHVIVEAEFRGDEEVRILLKDSENLLKSMGYFKTYCYILSYKKYMHKSALRHGYEEFQSDGEGTFYIKNLGG